MLEAAAAALEGHFRLQGQQQVANNSRSIRAAGEELPLPSLAP